MLDLPKYLISFSSAKIDKSNAANAGYKTGILYMAPTRKTCPFASVGCWSVCLKSAGRGRFDNVKKARAQRVALYQKDRAEFDRRERHELKLFSRRCAKVGKVGAYRPGGLDDTGRGTVLSREFTEIQFYDYTKDPDRFSYVMTRRPAFAGYHLTFSYSGDNWAACKEALKVGNVAVVFRGLVPTRWNGLPVYNGELSDLRFLDPAKGYIIGLTAKGDAKKDTSGFVVDAPDRGIYSTFYAKK